jgi:hypothetical protein
MIIDAKDNGRINDVEGGLLISIPTPLSAAVVL